LDASARLVKVFEVSSQFSAMQTYHAYLGREPYTANDAAAFEPYPESWKTEQKSGEAEWCALHSRWL